MITEKLWIEHSNRICNYFKKRTGDRALSCDLMQDTFHKVLDSQDKLERVENHQAWLYRIARNRLIDYTRKIKEESLNDTTVPAADNYGEVNESNIEDISECLDQLIREYDEMEQEILLKVFQKSLTQKEVAEYFNIPYSTFKSRVQKARKQIVNEFNERCCRLKYNRDGNIIGCG